MVTFIFQQLAFAAPQLNTFTTFTPLNTLQMSFDFPESVALIEDSYKAPKSSKTVFLLQDAHTNESGQANLAKALDLIIKNESIEYVFTEAAKGDASLSYLKPNVDLSTRLQVSKALLNKGLLHGAEYLNLTSPYDFTIWGVEDRDLYDQGLLLYKQIIADRQSAMVYLNKISRTASTLKTRLFTDELRVFDTLRTQYHAEKMSITDYFEHLQGIVNQHAISLQSFESLKSLKKLKDIESKLDFDAASREQNQIMQGLSIEDQKLMQNSLKQGVQKIKGTSSDASSNAFYALLQEKTESSIDAYPNLKAYLKYINEAKELSAKSVLDELSNLEEKIANRLIQNSNQKMLYTISDNTRLLKQLFELKITPAEFKIYQTNKIYFNTKVIIGFLNKQIIDLDKHYEQTVKLDQDFEANVQRIEEFYQLTYARDLIFFKNIQDKMNSSNQDKAIVITGGYHTPNLKELLKANGISFVSIMPQVLHETNYSRYESLLLSQLDKTFTTANSITKGAAQWMTLLATELSSPISSPVLDSADLSVYMGLTTAKAPLFELEPRSRMTLIEPSGGELPAQIRATVDNIFNLLPVTAESGIPTDSSYAKPAHKAELIQGRTQWRLIIEAMRQMNDLAYSLKKARDLTTQDVLDYPGKKVAIEYFEAYAQILLDEITVNTDKLNRLLEARESQVGIDQSMPEHQVEAGLAQKWLDQGRIQGQVRGEITRELQSITRYAGDQTQAQKKFEYSLNKHLEDILEEINQSIYKEYLVELAFKTENKSDKVTEFLLTIAQTEKKAGTIDGRTMYKRIVTDILSGSEFQNSRIEEIIADSADFVDLFLEFGNVDDMGTKPIPELRAELVKTIIATHPPEAVLKGREFLLVSDVHASSYGINTLRLYAPGAKPIIVGDLVDRGHELEEVIKSTKRFTLADHDLWALGAAFGDRVLTAHWMRSNYRDNNRSILVQLGIDLTPMDVLTQDYLQKDWLSADVESDQSVEIRTKEADRRIKAKKKIKDVDGNENLKRSFNNVHELAAANIWLKLWAQSEWAKKNAGKTWSIEPFNILAHADESMLLLQEGYSAEEIEILKVLRSGSSSDSLDLSSLRDKWQLTDSEVLALRDMQLQFLNSQKMRDLAEHLLRFGKVYEVLGQSALLESIDEGGVENKKHLAENKALLLHSVFPVNQNGQPVDLAGNAIEFAKLQSTLDEYQLELDVMAEQWQKLVSKKTITDEDLNAYAITVEGSFEFVRDLADGVYSPLYARAQQRGHHMYISPVEEVDNLAYVLWEENAQSDHAANVPNKKRHFFSEFQKESLKTVYDLKDEDFVIVRVDGREVYQLANPSVNEKIIRVFAEAFGVKTIIGGHKSLPNGRIKTSGGEEHKFLRIDPYFVDKGGVAAEIPTGLASGVLFDVNGFREISLPPLKEVLTYAKDADLAEERKQIRSFLLPRITLADIAHYELEIQANDLALAKVLKAQLFELLEIIGDVAVLRKRNVLPEEETRILLNAIKSQPDVVFVKEIIDAEVVRQLLTLAGQPLTLANTYLRNDAQIKGIASTHRPSLSEEDGIERPEPGTLYHRTQLGVSADMKQQIAETHDKGDLALFLRAKKSTNYQALRKILALLGEEGQEVNHITNDGLSEEDTDAYIFAKAEKTGRSYAEIVLSMYGDTSFNKSSKFKYGDTTQKPSPEIYPEAIVIGGGTAAAVVVKALKKTEFAQGFEASYDATNNVLIPLIASYVPNTDDGGSTFELITYLKKHGYGVIPPLGDQVNALFKSFLDARKFDKVLDGRIIPLDAETYKTASSYAKAMSDVVTQKRGFEDAMLIALQWTWGYLRDIGDARKQPKKKDEETTPENKLALPKLEIPDDFVFFAANMLTLARVVDKEFKLGTEHAMLDLSKASIRNFVLLGALVDAGALPKGEPDHPESAFGTEDAGVLYQQALVDLLSATGIQDGISMITSYDPRTLYAKYQHTVLAIRNPENEKEFYVIKIERQEDESAMKSIIISDVGTDLTSEDKSLNTLEAGRELTLNVFGKEANIGLNAEHQPYISVNGQQINLNETKDGNLMIMQGDDTFAMSDNGTGLTVADVENNTKAGVILSGMNFFIRPPLTIMQTHMTDNLNLSKVVATGILGEGQQVLTSNSAVDGSDFRIIPTREQQKLKPNLQAIETLKRAQRLVVFGPGSVDTSEMPHLFIPEFVEALAAKKDVKRVFVFNSNLDNETIGYDANGIMGKIEGITGRKFEDLFDVVVVGSINPDKKAEITQMMTPQLSFEFRSPGDPSTQAKKPRGAFDPLNDIAGDNRLVRLEREGKIEIFKAPMIDIITSQDRATGAIKEGLGFDPDLLGGVFDRIIASANQEKVDPRIFYGDMNAVGDESLKNEQVDLVARAFGTLVRSRSHDSSPSVVIAGDTRLNTPRIKAAFISGLRKTGVNVIDLGIAPIGFAYLAQKFFVGVQGGVMISGGSNKADINGIKLFYADRSLDPNDQEWGLPKVDEFIRQGDFNTGNGSLTQADLSEDYIEYIKTHFRTPSERWIQNVVLPQESGVKLIELVRDARADDRESWQPLLGSKLVLDSGNGAVGSIAKDIFVALGAEVVSLYEDADGHFPNHVPNPHVIEGLESLIAGVKRHEADFGLAFSGDGQRLGIVDSDRSIISTDDVLSIFAMHAAGNYQRHNGSEGQASVVLDRKSLQSLRDRLEGDDVKVHLSQVGFAHIRNEAIAGRAAFAGETYSQYMFRDGFFAMDAIFAAATFLKIMYQVDERIESESITPIKPLRPMQLVGEKYNSIPEVRIPYTFGANTAHVSTESVALDIVRDLIHNAQNQTRLDDLKFEPLKIADLSKNTAPSERMEWTGADGKVAAWLRIEASHNHPEISVRAEAVTATLLEEVLELAWRSLSKQAGYIDLHNLQTLLRNNFGGSTEWNSLGSGQARMAGATPLQVNASKIDEVNPTDYLYVLTDRILNENYIPHTDQEIQAITQLAAKVAEKGFFPILWDSQHLSIVEVDGAEGMVDIKVGSKLIQHFNKSTVLERLNESSEQTKLAVDNVANILGVVHDFKYSMLEANQALNQATQNGKRTFNFDFGVPVNELFDFGSIQDETEQLTSAEFLLSIMNWAAKSSWGAGKIKFHITNEDIVALPNAQLQEFWSKAIQKHTFLSSENLDYANSETIGVKWIVNGQAGHKQALNINMSPVSRGQLPQHFLSGITTALEIFYEVVPDSHIATVDAKAYFHQARTGLNRVFDRMNNQFTIGFDDPIQMLIAVQNGLYSPKQYLRSHIVSIDAFLRIMRIAISTTRMSA